MLIQRRPSPSTDSTFGSAGAATWAESTRVRAERLRRGLGMLGMVRTQGVVAHFCCLECDSTSVRGSLPVSCPQRRYIERGGGTWPYEAPATIRLALERCQLHEM